MFCSREELEDFNRNGRKVHLVFCAFIIPGLKQRDANLIFYSLGHCYNFVEFLFRHFGDG